jgi:hypothetical protein
MDNESAKKRNHKGISSLGDELIDPALNPPWSVNCVPKTLYSPKIRNRSPTPIRSMTIAMAFALCSLACICLFPFVNLALDLSSPLLAESLHADCSLPH